jgi:lipopolysaccharide export system permease protein
MKLIDRYILKGFLFSFLVVFVSMMALAIMVDMVINIDEFMKVGKEESGLAAWDVAGYVCSYYFYRAFEYFQWLCGAAMLVGAAFAMARLNKTNELVALKASGVSVYRLLWPIIAAGLVISGLYVVNQEVIIPGISDHLMAKRSPGERSREMEVQYVTDRNNALIYAPRFDPQRETLEAIIRLGPDQKTVVSRQPVSIVVRDRQTSESEYFIEADRAVYNRRRGGWLLANGVRWAAGAPAARGGIFGEGEPFSFFATNLDPDSLARQQHKAYYLYLSLRGLSQLIKDSALAGPRIYEVAMHQHFAKPILNLIILLLGLPFVVGREGKSYFASITVCVGLFVLVLATEYVAVEFGRSDYISPLLAAYLPVLIFTPVAIWSLDTVKT